MTSSTLRTSRFRHIYGENLKREKCFDGIRVSKMTACQANICIVNPKFLAVVVDSSGGGAFLILSLSKTGRVCADHPLVNGHKAPVLDIGWCPHNDHVIASASEDCSAKVWIIPEGGLTTSMQKPVADLMFHRCHVNLLLWHPTAANILLTAGKDYKIAIWDVRRQQMLLLMESHTDVIYSVSFNWNGSQLLTTSRDKKLRIFEAHTGVLINEGTTHEAVKPTQAIFLRNDFIFTTGFNKGSHRQFTLRAIDDLDNPLVLTNWDVSNRLLNIWYDPDVDLIYLCGKGDARINYFEIQSRVPYVTHMGTLHMSDPVRGLGMMPKRGCDIFSNEIGRLFRISHNGFCQIISFLVPRKSTVFQEDLYPDTVAPMPSITASQWFRGISGEPIKLSLREQYTKLGNERKSTRIGIKETTSTTFQAQELNGDNEGNSDCSDAGNQPLYTRKNFLATKAKFENMEKDRKLSASSSLYRQHGGYCLMSRERFDRTKEIIENTLRLPNLCVNIKSNPSVCSFSFPDPVEIAPVEIAPVEIAVAEKPKKKETLSDDSEKADESFVSMRVRQLESRQADPYVPFRKVLSYYPKTMVADLEDNELMSYYRSIHIDDVKRLSQEINYLKAMTSRREERICKVQADFASLTSTSSKDAVYLSNTEVATTNVADTNLTAALSQIDSEIEILCDLNADAKQNQESRFSFLKLLHSNYTAFEQNILRHEAIIHELENQLHIPTIWPTEDCNCRHCMIMKRKLKIQGDFLDCRKFKRYLTYNPNLTRLRQDVATFKVIAGNQDQRLSELEKLIASPMAIDFKVCLAVAAETKPNISVNNDDADF